MTEPPDESSRPDGRTPSAHLVALRAATRALRVHLDKLPIDYNEGFSGDRFLAGLAFMSARIRYDCAESMIGAGFGGTVLGSLARSVFVDGLRWLWIAADPEARRLSLLGDLLQERSRLCRLLRTTDTSCPILTRWLMPLPDIADLTGASNSWLSAPPVPNEQALLDDFLTQPTSSSTTPSSTASVETGADRARSLLDLAGLRGAVAVLAHAGHGNILGLRSSLTDDGVPGHDLREDHEALFMHVAAAGVAATLLGGAAAVPELWPVEIDMGPFLDETLRLAEEVCAAARSLHKLKTTKPFTGLPKPAQVKPVTEPLESDAVIAADDLLPDVNSIDQVADAADDFYDLARSFVVDVRHQGSSSLQLVLMFTGGHSGLQSVMSTYDQPGSEVIAVFAARMLLEEAARHHWRYQDFDRERFIARSTQYADEFRQKERKAIALLTGNGVPVKNARALFALPSNVVLPVVPPSARKNREKLPSVDKMLAAMGASYAEPGWVQVAYSLLSQITHATPIGLMHSIRWKNSTWNANDMSPEMVGLALDVACLASAELIGVSALALTDVDPAAGAFLGTLRSAALRVHRSAQLVPGLD